MLKCVCIVALFIGLPVWEANAQGSEFCKGFTEGYRTIRGELGIVPICPIAPITPIGGTAFREGIKVGILAGRKAGGGGAGGATSSGASGTFCDGFKEGWKTVKGNLAIVPICPIAPITPMGSNAYREGIKAGIAKGNGA